MAAATPHRGELYARDKPANATAPIIRQMFLVSWLFMVCPSLMSKNYRESSLQFEHHA